MTCFSMVFLVWFAEVWLGKSPMMAITLFSDRDVAKASEDSRSVWGKLQRKPLTMAITLFLGRPCAKTATTCEWLGKILEKPPIMATTLFLDSDHAKASDNPRPVGKNFAGDANHGDS